MTEIRLPGSNHQVLITEMWSLITKIWPPRSGLMTKIRSPRSNHRDLITKIQSLRSNHSDLISKIQSPRSYLMREELLLEHLWQLACLMSNKWLFEHLRQLSLPPPPPSRGLLMGWKLGRYEDLASGPHALRKKIGLDQQGHVVLCKRAVHTSRAPWLSVVETGHQASSFDPRQLRHWSDWAYGRPNMLPSRGLSFMSVLVCTHRRDCLASMWATSDAKRASLVSPRLMTNCKTGRQGPGVWTVTCRYRLQDAWKACVPIRTDQLCGSNLIILACNAGFALYSWSTSIQSRQVWY